MNIPFVGAPVQRPCFNEICDPSAAGRSQFVARLSKRDCAIETDEPISASDIIKVTHPANARDHFSARARVVRSPVFHLWGNTDRRLP
jgi:hypothetical protein